MVITIFGIGYVGFSLGVLLAKKNQVFGITTNKDKVKGIKRNIIPINNKILKQQYSLIKNNFEITINYKQAIKQSDFVIIAVPTDYNKITRSLNTSIVKKVVKKTLQIKNVPIIIKSTVPIGFTKKIQQKYTYSNILYCPEFLKEKTCFQDIVNPSRIICGINSKNQYKIALKFLNILIENCQINNIPKIILDSEEAEAIKLFANTYLGMRLIFFNELKNFCLSKNINFNNVIYGIGLDKRIGLYYNKPINGYGGKCLPKDIKELIHEFKINKIKNYLIKNIDKSNNFQKKNKREI